MQFLDVTAIIADKKIIFDLYKKPIFSGRYINFYSCYFLKRRPLCIIWLIKSFFFPIPDFMKRILRKPLIHCLIIVTPYHSFSPLSVLD